ncbi:MAG: hypothetical protein LKE33_09650 [Acidaminococcus sp.]|jgi:hypothetical protein|nr:hypothetical protein [Acidaminococcus sp.]MCI2101070.1 hypothetical protein [Acidaminococcus sp.]MCI2115479.1 hypothetical protein [Acidaminococcus sp.]MCI2117597.1 hypothetical protein [Acidaminococcus sp.]
MKRYEDILHRPYPDKPHCHTMPQAARAAQFASFDALEGYGDIVRETARFTDTEHILDEEAKAELDRHLQALMHCIDEGPVVAITCFLPDARKEGGKYVEIKGMLRKIDLTRKTLTLETGEVVPVKRIVKLEKV